MKKLIQTRLHNPPIRGNCFPTVIACIMDLNSPEDAFQFQEHYDSEDGWYHLLEDWLFNKGWQLNGLNGHLDDGAYYFVSGKTKRSKTVSHICIYKNGKLYHDPHPDQSGLTTEDNFEFLERIKTHE